MKIVVISPHMQNPYPNIGDSYIAGGIANLLREHEITWMPLHRRPSALDIARINHSDRVVIGGSNIIGNLQTFYCSWSANDFSAIEVPIIPLALGAQADAGQSPALTAEARRYSISSYKKAAQFRFATSLPKNFW